MNAKEIAMKLLTDAGCDLWCYQDDYNNALKDINYIIEHDGRQFEVPAKDIAQALVDIAKENPKPEEPIKRFTVVYDGDSFIDGFDCETLEEAIARAEDILILWQQEEIHNWKFENGIPHPTQKQIEDWDYMIYNFDVWVEEKDDNGEVIDEHHFTDEEYKKVGWMEWEELKPKLTQA